MSGFICGKNIKDGSIPVDRVIGYDKLLFKSEFDYIFKRWATDNVELLCVWIKDGCDRAQKDLNPPTVSFPTPTFPNGGGSHTINMSVTDDDPNITYIWGSECPELSLSFSDRYVKNPTITSVNHSVSQDITCEIYVTVCDGSNNCTKVRKTIVIPKKLDTTKPSVSVSWGDINQTVGKTQLLTINATDDSGVEGNLTYYTFVEGENCAQVMYPNTKTPNILFTKEGDSGNKCIICSRVTDKAGNSATECMGYIATHTEFPLTLSNPVVNNNNITVSAHGGSGAYTYSWVVSPKECYKLEGSRENRTISCLKDVKQTCTEAKVIATVYDGETTVSKEVTVNLLCESTTIPAMDISNSRLSFNKLISGDSTEVTCPYTIQSADDSYQYEYLVYQSLESPYHVGQSELTIKRGSEVVGTYRGKGRTITAPKTGELMYFDIPKADISMKGNYTFLVSGKDINGKDLVGAKTYTCTINV